MCCGAEQRGRSGGSCTAPGLQHSVCCVMETPAFNYGGCKTLLSVCVCVTSLPLCLLHRWWEMFRVFFISSWVLLALSAREGLDHLHLHAVSGARVCLELSVCPWSQPPHTSLLLCPLVQLLPEPDALGPWALWSPRKLWSFGHFQSTALMLTAVSKVMVSHYSRAVSGGNQGEENQWRKHFSI